MIYKFTKLLIQPETSKLAQAVGSDSVSITKDDLKGCSKIRGSAFLSHNGLTSIAIPNTVTSIGDSAFESCKNLNSVDLSGASKLATIGSKAFHDAGLIGAKIVIPANVTDIGTYAFYKSDAQNGLSSLTFAANSKLITIGSHAFSRRKIKTVVIPDTVTTIGANAFYHCYDLAEITLGKGVTSIGDSAFISCSALTKAGFTGTIADWCNIKFSNYRSNPINQTKGLWINGTELKDVIIPEGASIKAYAFYNGSNFTSFTLPVFSLL